MLKIKYNNTFPKNIYLEALTVCVGFSDYLEHFLKYNLKHFDKLIVVTTKSDTSTIKLCKSIKVNYVFTNRLGQSFNKGKAINDGLKKLSMKDWLLIIDADIILEKQFRNKTEQQKLNIKKLYGAIRINCLDYPSWEKYSLLNGSEQELFLKNESLKKMYKRNRTVREWNSGRKQIVGYFQLLNCKNKIIEYPEQYEGANKSDREFFNQWEFFNREFLQNINVLHLDNTGRKGINWFGRKSPEFKKDTSIIDYGKKDL